METELDEWELVSADGNSSQLTCKPPAEVKQDAGEKNSIETEPSAKSDEEYDCVVLLLLSAITEWCSWALPAVYAQALQAAQPAMPWARTSAAELRAAGARRFAAGCSFCEQALRRGQQALGPWRFIAKLAALPSALVAALFLLHMTLGRYTALSERPVGFQHSVGSPPCTVSPAGKQLLGPCLTSPSGQQLGYVDPVGRTPCTAGPAGERLLGPCLVSPSGQRLGYVNPVGRTPCTVGPAGERLLGPCLVSPSGQRLAPPSPADARALDGFAFKPHAQQQAPGAAVGAAGPLGASGPAFGPCMDRPGYGARRPRSAPMPRGALAFEPCLDLSQSGAPRYKPCLDLPQRELSPARGAFPLAAPPRAAPCMDLSPGAATALARAERKGPGAPGPSTAGRRGAPLVSVNGPPGPSAPGAAGFAALPPRAYPLPSSGHAGAAPTNISAPVLPPVAYALSGAAGACAAARGGAKSTALEGLAAARAAACRHTSGALPAAACGHAAAQGRRGAGAGAASSALTLGTARLGSVRRHRGAPSAVATASAAFLDDFGAALAQNRALAAQLAHHMLPMLAEALNASSSRGMPPSRLVQLRAELASQLAELEAAADAALASHARLAAAAGAEADEHASLCAIAGPALAVGDGSASFAALSPPLLPGTQAGQHELAVDGAAASAGYWPQRACGQSLLGKGRELEALDLAGVAQAARRLRADMAFARRIAGALGGGQPALPPASARVQGFLDQGAGLQALAPQNERAWARAGPAEGGDTGVGHAHQGGALAGGRRAAAAAMVAAAAELAHALQEDV